MNINLGGSGKGGTAGGASRAKRYGLNVPNKRAKKKLRVVSAAGASTNQASSSASSSQIHATPAAAAAAKEAANKQAYRAEIKAANASFHKAGDHQRLKAQQVFKEALEQDASVFDYDGVYDSVSTKARGETRKANAAAAALDSDGEDQKPKSKYLEQLKQVAKQREFMMEKAEDRKALREQVEQESELGKVEEVFVTGAYKRRLEERKQFELKEARKAADEAKNDVRKKGNLNGFYSGMLAELEGDQSRTAVLSAAQKQKQQEEEEQQQQLLHTQSEEQPGRASGSAGVSSSGAGGSGDVDGERGMSVLDYETDKRRKSGQQQQGDKQRELESQVVEARRKRAEEEENSKRVAPTPKTTQDRLQEAKARALARKQQRQQKESK